MIHGATGFTGRMVAREAIALGERPLLAGRSADKVRRVAEELGLPWVAFDLGYGAAAVAALRGVELVLLAAGPFDGLAQPMMDACLEARAHYTDLDNELPVFRAAKERDARARERGVAIVPGIGFGTIATGSLVKRVVAALPDATRLECALHIATTDGGPATGESVLAAIRMGGRIRRGGRLVEHPLGAGGREIPFADRSRRASPVPTGDLEAAWMDTRIPDIVVYGTALPGGCFQRAGIAIRAAALDSARFAGPWARSVRGGVATRTARPGRARPTRAARPSRRASRPAKASRSPPRCHARCPGDSAGAAPRRSAAATALGALHRLGSGRPDQRLAAARRGRDPSLEGRS